MESEDEELLQLSILRTENPSLYKILLDSLLANHYAVFKSLLQRGLQKHPPSISIDHRYPYPTNKTLLDVASSEGRPDFVKLLLDFGASPNRINESHNRAPIHFAAESGHHDVILALLDDPRTNPNLEVGRETALHFAVKNKHLKCAKVLLENNSSPNVPNNRGITALHSAATASNREMVETILNHSRLSPDVDTFRDFRKRSARQILNDKFPDLSLPPPGGEKPVDFNTLRFYLDANDEHHFLEKLKSVAEEGTQSGRLEGEDKLIVIAAERNLKTAVTELLRRIREVGSVPRAALEAAVRRGHHDILGDLLRSGVKIDNEVLMIACQQLGVPCRFGVEQQSRIKCLRLLLEQPDVQVRIEDEKGNCPLHYAARAEDPEAVELLLKAGSFIGHANAFGVPPIAHISPKVLEDHLDSCLRSKSDRTDDYEIEFDYKCLMPHAHSVASSFEETSQTLLPKRRSDGWMYSSNIAEMETLSYISKSSSLKHLLKHPIVASFLHLKWHSIRHILYANLAFYVFFYIFINCYILVLNYKPTSLLEDVSVNSSTIVLLRSEGQLDGLWSLTAIFLVGLTIREVLQLLSSPKHYIVSFENCLEVILIFLAAAVLAGAGRQVGALVILLSAWELVILIGQHPKMSTGIEMFKTVTWNFVKFLFLYAFLILAFALAFVTLFKDIGDDNFSDPGHALFKTIIMLTGEFDASDIPFVSRPGLSHAIFILFVFLIAIVLFNLLNGLAVSDTADILGKAELVGLISRTELVAYAERVAVGTRFSSSSSSSSRRSCLCPCPTCPSKGVDFLGFVRRRLLLFSRHLVLGKLGVKPYKGNYITFQGVEAGKMRGCRGLTMDSLIVNRARDILRNRSKVSEYQTVMAELEIIRSWLMRLEGNLKAVSRGAEEETEGI
ncbi:transient receptor potential cation channel protein painless [Diachasma alloeum]|uniref:transient receptor potential cation channel protein painless n=1 Tax=Diachasma alloeum TaxID=454923 RepID=UPI0007384ABA|nr:transient receptor potential cation channel protein painless [Diachasma alloeum]